MKHISIHFFWPKVWTEFVTNSVIFLFLWRWGPTRTRDSSFLGVLDHTQRRSTFGRPSLDEWSARRRDYLTTLNNHNGQTFMSPVGFEPTISAGERPQKYTLGYGYIGARTHTTKQTNICLGVHLQTCLVAFNTTCLSRLVATKGRLFPSLFIVGDVNVTWCTFLMLVGTKFCWW
jgi:hypothetical protein